LENWKINLIIWFNIITYLNNQYLKLDLPVNNIAKLKININDKPNIIIAYGYKVDILK